MQHKSFSPSTHFIPNIHKSQHVSRAGNKPTAHSAVLADLCPGYRWLCKRPPTRAANTSRLRSCGSATQEAPRAAQLGVSPESSHQQRGRPGWEVLLGKMAETLEEVMFSPQQVVPSLPQRETLDTDSEPQVSTDTLTGARTPWQYPQRAALGLQTFTRSDAHLPVWLASVRNGDRGDVTGGEAAQAKAGLEPKLLRG